MHVLGLNCEFDMAVRVKNTSYRVLVNKSVHIASIKLVELLKTISRRHRCMRSGADAVMLTKPMLLCVRMYCCTRVTLNVYSS